MNDRYDSLLLKGILVRVCFGTLFLFGQNDGFANEAPGLLRDVKDQAVKEILLKQIRALI